VCPFADDDEVRSGDTSPDCDAIFPEMCSRTSKEGSFFDDILGHQWIGIAVRGIRKRKQGMAMHTYQLKRLSDT